MVRGALILSRGVRTVDMTDGASYIRYREDSIQAMPHNINAHFNLGVAYARIGRSRMLSRCSRRRPR